MASTTSGTPQQSSVVRDVEALLSNTRTLLRNSTRRSSRLSNTSSFNFNASRAPSTPPSVSPASKWQAARKLPISSMVARTLMNQAAGSPSTPASSQQQPQWLNFNQPASAALSSPPGPEPSAAAFLFEQQGLPGAGQGSPLWEAGPGGGDAGTPSPGRRPLGATVGPDADAQREQRLQLMLSPRYYRTPQYDAFMEWSRSPEVHSSLARLAPGQSRAADLEVRLVRQIDALLEDAQRQEEELKERMARVIDGAIAKVKLAPSVLQEYTAVSAAAF